MSSVFIKGTVAVNIFTLWTYCAIAEQNTDSLFSTRDLLVSKSEGEGLIWSQVITISRSQSEIQTDYILILRITDTTPQQDLVNINTMKMLLFEWF